MGFFFGKKEKEVDALIAKHLEMVGRTLAALARMIDDYLKQDKAFKGEGYEVHSFEHEADKIRREAERKMEQGAFLPIYREDYIVLLELVDRVANKAEAVADFITLTRPNIPGFLEEGLRPLVAANVDIFKPLSRMYEMFQEDANKVLEIGKAVSEREQFVDRLQWDLTKAVFKSDLTLAEKLHLKEFIDEIAAISDRAEDVADRFEIMVVKRPA